MDLGDLFEAMGALVWGLFQKVFPPRRASDAEIRALEARFRRHTGFDSLFYAVSTLLLVVLLGVAFSRLSDWWTEQAAGGADFVFRPAGNLLFIPAVLLAPLVALVPVRLFARYRLRSQWRDYIESIDLWRGFRRREATRFMALVVGIPAALLLALLLDYRTAFWNDRMEINPFLGFGGASHSYEELAEVRNLRRKRGAPARWRLSFEDGTTWDTSRLERFDAYPDSVIDRLGRFLSEASSREGSTP